MFVHNKDGLVDFVLNWDEVAYLKWLICKTVVRPPDMVCDAQIEKSATQADLPVSGATQQEEEK